MIDNKEHIILTLQLIGSNGNTSFLENLGYDYAQIAKFISSLRKKKYVDFVKDGLVLTPLGKEYLFDLNNELNRKGVSSLISPLLHCKIEKIDKFDVYLPLVKK